jgi:hypothetical protein
LLALPPPPVLRSHATGKFAPWLLLVTLHPSGLTFSKKIGHKILVRIGILFFFLKRSFNSDAFLSFLFYFIGTYPIIVVVGFALMVSTYKIVHDIRSPEAHFSKSERTSLDYIENERVVADGYTSHRTLHQKV